MFTEICLVAIKVALEGKQGEPLEHTFPGSRPGLDL